MRFADFDYVYHSVVDLLLIVIGFATVHIVSRQGWRHHLCWVSPGAAASVLIGLDRPARDLHRYLGLGTPANTNLTISLFDNSGKLVWLYSAFMLWRTLHALARHQASTDPLAIQLPQPGVWPPPPTLRS